MEQLDPRLIEIEILSEADRAFVRGDASYEYTKANPSGARDRQRDEALLGLISESAVVGAGALRASKNYVQVPDPNRPYPRFALDEAAARAIAQFLSPESILKLKITQVGRLRLFRLRDEILQRDRIRDAFAGLWVKQHFLPDLTVKLRIRDLGKPISLIVIDVDNLRDINAELGHHGADQVLTGIFEVLRDVVQPHEAYRLGGDEAGAILPEVSLDMAQKLGEEIRALIAGRAWEGLAVQTKPTVSVGVGTYTSTGQIEAAALYAAVDALAIQAKESGKNKVISADVPLPGD
jgi:diguanylate cyclase (GGDEF)-like protein